MQGRLIRSDSEHEVGGGDRYGVDAGMVHTSPKFCNSCAITGAEEAYQGSLLGISFCRVLDIKCDINTTSLAVAMTSPSGLISIALNAEVWAGTIRTFPDSNSTSCTWPGVRPGNASNFDDRQHKPRGLSAVSVIETFSGGEENM